MALMRRCAAGVVSSTSRFEGFEDLSTRVSRTWATCSHHGLEGVPSGVRVPHCRLAVQEGLPHLSDLSGPEARVIVLPKQRKAPWSGQNTTAIAHDTRHAARKPAFSVSSTLVCCRDSVVSTIEQAWPQHAW